MKAEILDTNMRTDPPQVISAENVLGEVVPMAKSVSQRKGRGGPDGDRSVEWHKAKILGASFVRHCRLQAGWSQAQLAEVMKVSASYIGQIESMSADRRAPLEFLIAVATATGTHFEVKFSDHLAPAGTVSV
jgi:DNA-binding XRE family transcriptional regulator